MYNSQPAITIIISLKNWKIHIISCEIYQKSLLIKTQVCKLRVISDTSIARVTGCAYPRKGYRSVISLLMPGSRGPRRSALFCARTLYNPHWGGQTRHVCNSVCIKQLLEVFVVVLVWVNFCFCSEWATWAYRVRTQVLVYSLCMWQASGGLAQAWCSGC